MGKRGISLTEKNPINKFIGREKNPDSFPDDEGACHCKALEDFVTMVSDIYLFVDSDETQAVSNDKRVPVIIFRQVMIRFLELIYLLRSNHFWFNRRR